MGDIAKYRDPSHPDRWYLTDFTMEQVEGRIATLEAENKRLKAQVKKAYDSAEHEFEQSKLWEARSVGFESQLAEAQARLEEATDHKDTALRQRDEAERQLAKLNSILEWIEGVVTGQEVGEFGLSFLIVQMVRDRFAEAKADLRNALALLRYCFDGNDIPVIYTVEELREWVKGDSGQGAIAAARGEG